MAKRKAITVTASHEGKRWKLSISATDPEARKKIIKAIMALETKENGGFVIQNGASPFGDEEPEKPNGAANEEQAGLGL